MSTQSGLFLLLVLPALAAAILVYLGILTLGLGALRAAFRSAHPSVKVLLFPAGLLIILGPLLFHAGMEMRAQQRADARQTDLAQLRRVDLAGRLPDRFIVVGDFGPETVDFIRTRYRLRSYSEAENRRLVDAYRGYRRAELCRRRFQGETLPGTKLPKCRPLAGSVQTALDLDEPVLVFAEGSDTSMREDNVRAGEIYELRLITPQEDLLAAYYEERTVEGTPSLFNPYAPPRRLDSDGLPPTLQAFIETAMQGASR